MLKKLQGSRAKIQKMYRKFQQVPEALDRKIETIKNILNSSDHRCIVFGIIRV